MWPSIFKRNTDKTPASKSTGDSKDTKGIEDGTAPETPKKTFAQTAYDYKGTIATGLVGATVLGLGGAALLGAFGGGGGGTSAGAQPPSNPTSDQATGATGTTSLTGADATKADTQTGQLQTPNGLSQILSGNIQQKSFISESITQHLNQLQQDIVTDILPPPPSSFLKDLI